MALRSTLGYQRPAMMLLLAVASLAAPQNSSPRCTYIPTDDGWPTKSEWALLNSTVGGRLIATVPQASVCHNAPYSDYDAASCAALAKGWNSAQTL